MLFDRRPKNSFIVILTQDVLAISFPHFSLQGIPTEDLKNLKEKLQQEVVFNPFFYTVY